LDVDEARAGMASQRVRIKEKASPEVEAKALAVEPLLVPIKTRLVLSWKLDTASILQLTASTATPMPPNPLLPPDLRVSGKRRARAKARAKGRAKAKEKAKEKARVKARVRARVNTKPAHRAHLPPAEGKRTNFASSSLKESAKREKIAPTATITNLWRPKCGLRAINSKREHANLANYVTTHTTTKCVESLPRREPNPNPNQRNQRFLRFVGPSEAVLVRLAVTSTVKCHQTLEAPVPLTLLPTVTVQPPLLM
jgi:hypothetical protein